MTNDSAATSHDAPASRGPEQTRDAFGRDLSAARRAHGWSMDDLAARAGITRKTVSRIESGQAVRISTIRDLERAFDVPDGTITRAYYGEVTLRKALSDVDKDEPTRSLNLTRSAQREDGPAHEEVASATPGTPSLAELVDGIMRDRGYIDVEASAPRTAEDAFALVQHLPPTELRRLRERIDGVLQFLERPLREDVIDRAVRQMRDVRACSDAARRALVVATQEAEQAQGTTDRQVTAAAEATRVAAEEQERRAQHAYRAWLDATARELSKRELAEVMSRLGEPHWER